MSKFYNSIDIWNISFTSNSLSFLDSYISDKSTFFCILEKVSEHYRSNIIIEWRNPDRSVKSFLLGILNFLKNINIYFGTSFLDLTIKLDEERLSDVIVSNVDLLDLCLSKNLSKELISSIFRNEVESEADSFQGAILVCKNSFSDFCDTLFSKSI
jgi:hypothetical protein